MSVAMGAPIIFPLFSIPFWIVGVAMVRKAIGTFLGRTLLRIDDDGLRFQRRVLLPGRVSIVPLGRGERRRDRSAAAPGRSTLRRRARARPSS